MNLVRSRDPTRVCSSIRSRYASYLTGSEHRYSFHNLELCLPANQTRYSWVIGSPDITTLLQSNAENFVSGFDHIDIFDYK